MFMYSMTQIPRMRLIWDWSKSLWSHLHTINPSKDLSNSYTSVFSIPEFAYRWNFFPALQKDGTNNGVIDLTLKWQFAYMPPKASTKTLAQVLIMIIYADIFIPPPPFPPHSSKLPCLINPSLCICCLVKRRHWERHHPRQLLLQLHLPDLPDLLHPRELLCLLKLPWYGLMSNHWSLKNE